MSDVHPDLGPIAFLLGSWEGDGHGDYPTIDAFDYREQVTFTNPPGKPFIAYRQMTWASDDGRPLHTEAGYLRAGEGGRFEFVMAQPSGFVEVYDGHLNGATLTFVTTTVVATPTAKRVDELSRTISVDGDELRYVLKMAAVGHPRLQHLDARLRRVIN